MGQSSEWAIELHNERMANTEYAENYDRDRAMDEALYQAWLEQELENETLIDWFDDYRIDASGFEQRTEPEAVPQIDFDDLPF